jgi:Tol biopolymer transport system component
MSRGFAAFVAAATVAAAAADSGAAPPAAYASPAWSPTGRQIAFTSDRANPGSGRFEIYVMNLDGSGLRQLTNDANGYGKTGLAWSADGKWIAYQDYAYIDEVSSDGTQQRRLTGYGGFEPDFSPSGRRIAYGNGAAEFYSSIYVMRPDGTKKTLVAFPRANESLGSPTWSPDGERLAFSVGTAADTDFITPYLAIISRYRGNRAKLAVGHTIYSADWSPRGRKLLLVEDPVVNDPRGNARISVLDLRTRKLRSLGKHATYVAHWSPDGRRIVFQLGQSLFVMSADGSSVRRLTPR